MYQGIDEPGEYSDVKSTRSLYLYTALGREKKDSLGIFLNSILLLSMKESGRFPQLSGNVFRGGDVHQEGCGRAVHQGPIAVASGVLSGPSKGATDEGKKACQASLRISLTKLSGWKASAVGEKRSTPSFRSYAIGFRRERVNTTKIAFSWSGDRGSFKVPCKGASYQRS